MVNVEGSRRLAAEGSRLAAQAAVSAEEDVICRGRRPVRSAMRSWQAARRGGVAGRLRRMAHGRRARLGCTVALVPKFARHALLD